MTRALVLAAVVLGALPAGAAADCTASRSLRTGPTDGALYSTMAPFEHFTTARTQLFPHTCAVSGRVRARVAPGDYRTPYIATTRERDQMYLYGYGPDPATQGAYVASVGTRAHCAKTLADAHPRHGARAGLELPGRDGCARERLPLRRLRKHARQARSADRDVARRELPEDPNGTGAAYNGLIVMPDGRIVTKRIERGPCPAGRPPPTYPATVGAFTGFDCAAVNSFRPRLVVLDPGRLRVISMRRPAGADTGGSRRGRSHLRRGTRHLFRFRYRHGRLGSIVAGVRVYRTAASARARGRGDRRLPGGPDELPAPAEPLTVTAVSTHDSAGSSGSALSAASARAAGSCRRPRSTRRPGPS